MLRLDYRNIDRRAVIEWASVDLQAVWLEPLRRLIVDHSPDSRQENSFRVSLPWWSFVSIRSQFGILVSGYGLRMGQHVEVTETAQALLKKSKRYTDGYAKAQSAHRVDQSEIAAFLLGINFQRSLSPEQIRNISLLAAVPAAATFSVPGAGKTTEALATYLFRARDGERLLVISPKNAFAAWDEQISDCMPQLKTQFARLRGGRENIEQILRTDPKLMIITYQQLPRVSDLIAAHCSQFPTFVYLDESHKIKSGAAKQTARAVLDLSYVAAGKLIMSGTPMPQSVADLVPQISFLYPELVSNEDNVVELIKPIYVRTTKKELGLPPVTRHLISLQMAPMQYELYKLLKFEAARLLANLNIRDNQALRSLGRSVMQLLQFTSNPSLLSAQIGFIHKDLLAATLAEGDGPKLKYVLKRARELARQGHKVLIWSTFKRNVEYIADRLADLGAVYIHGDVDVGDEDDDETREGKIRRFHFDQNVKIMVANPAAASEGISLHKICHHAIYLDRAFNAAHYLQSEDRIHRFGLPQDQETHIEIVECIESIDELVRTRLEFKIGAMADVLEDSSLRLEPVPVDPASIDDYDDFSTGLDASDVQALIASLGVM